MKRTALTISAALLVFVSGLPLAAQGTATKSIPETAQAAGDFKTLVTAVKAAGLLETLAGDGPFTVLAPTDEAFAKLPEGTVASLVKPENKDKLIAILKLHVAKGKLTSDMAKPDGQFPTLAGTPLEVAVDDKTITIGGATVVKADVECSNGIIHAIDTVLLPTSFVDPKALIGKWTYVKAVANGADRTAEDLKENSVVITEESFTLNGEAKFVMDYEIDTNTTPNKIKFTITDSPFGAGMSTGGIIKMEGDQLVLSYSAQGGTAPTDFQSADGSGVNVFYLTKAK